MVPEKIVILSGRVCAGKSTLSIELRDKHGLLHLRTLDVLLHLRPDVERSRGALQELGERLDRQTDGSWVRDALQKHFGQEAESNGRIIVLDSVRIKGQVEAIRASYGRRVFHIHLTAPIDELDRRYKARNSKEIAELASYAQVQENKTEARIEDLAAIADIVIDTNRCTIHDVVTRAASHIGLYGREYLRLVDVLVGGQYGSEGKGQIAAYLASEYDVLVRVGGPNAGHTVYEEPKPYVFHQLPSGSANSKAQLVIGPGAVVNVGILQREIGDCLIDVERLAIDPQAMIISDEHREGETRLTGSIGSTGQGVGCATARKITGRGDGAIILAKDIRELQPYVRDSQRVLEEAFVNRQRVLLEGTQGTGLSIHHGVYPYVTSRDTTVAGCLAPE